MALSQERIEILKEANKRGILPPEKQQLFNTAVERGLITLEKQDQPEKSFMQDILSQMRKPLKIGEADMEKIKQQSNIDDRGLGLALAKGFVKSGQGLKQLSLDAAEGMGIVPKGTTENYTSKTEAERKLFADEFNKEFGDKARFKVAEGAGQIAPALLLGSLAPVGATLKGAMALGGLTGGVMGGTNFIPKDAEESRLAQTLVGAGMGVALAGAFNIFPGIRNFMRDKLGKAARTKGVTKALELSKRTGVDLKLTQLTDDPLAKTLEDISLKTIAGERAAGEIAGRQIAQNLKYWQRTAQKLSKGKENFGEKLKQTFEKTLGDSAKGTGLLGARAKQAKLDYAAVDKVTGSEKVIPITGFYDKTIELMKKYRTSSSPEKRRFAKVLLKTAQRFKSGKVNGRQLQDLLETYGSASKGTGRIFTDLDPSLERQLSKAVFSALQKDLSVAAKSNIPGASQLKLARNNYQKNSEAIRSLEQSAIFKMFGGKIPKTNEAVEKTFVAMNPSEIKGVMGILSKTDPTMQSRLQRFWIEKQMKKAAVTKEFPMPIFNPARMLDLKSGTGRDTFKAVFNTAESRRLVMDGIRVSQRVIARNEMAGNEGAAFMKGIAGVAASQDPTFVARLASEIFTPKAVSGYVKSKEGVELLRTLAKTNNTNVGATALIKLNDLRKEIQREDKDGN